MFQYSFSSNKQKKPRYYCLSSLYLFEKVPLTELFSEPFLMDLDLIWHVDWSINTYADRNR
jgi:hypothetical protein